MSSDFNLWPYSLMYLSADGGWPRKIMPCPSCQADYPTLPSSWGWIEDSPATQYLLPLCDMCEDHPAQWGEVDAGAESDQ
jgi:hypothetical protein